MTQSAAAGALRGSEGLAVLRGPSRPDLLRDECLADIVCDTAAVCPDHAALVWGSQAVTYRALRDDGLRIGRALAARGAGPGRIVGILMPRGADVLIAQVAVACSGAAWLPLDGDWPAQRIDACLRAAGAIGLLTCAAWIPRVAESTIPAWSIDDLRRDGIAGPAVLERPRASDPAYVIFTSGSTGEPKGIAISQRSICHLLRSENEMLGVCADDRVYHGFSTAFDMSFEETWLSFLAGATVWIAPPDVIADPDALAAAIARERITVLHAVPTLMALVHDPLASVRLINLGGEACPPLLPAKLSRAQRRIVNSYGPTETTVTATLGELRAGDDITIGLPLPNYGVLIVDAQHRPAGVGETGELCIFGPGLALGYVGRAELTAARFVANPVATGPDDERMFLTGDLAQIDAAGRVRMLGRTDDQVKVRGHRIELGEVSAALQQQPGVANAAALVRPIGEVDDLVGFVALARGASASVEAWRKGLAERLPRYMVPAHIEVVDALPRLTSGKVDVRALRDRALTGADDISRAEPRTEAEAALYSELACLCPGRGWNHDTDFFDDLGGHSLLVARLVSAVRVAPQYAGLGVQDVYGARRLSAIATRMERHAALAAGAGHAARPFVSAGVGTRLLCGLAQALVLPVFVLINVADWLAPFIVYHLSTGDEGDSVARAVFAALGALVLTRAAVFAIAIAGKRLLAGRLRPGRYPLWGLTYFRYWLSNRLTGLPPLHLIAGTAWLPMYLRAVGARVGRQVSSDVLTVAVPELLTIDDGVSIGTFVNIENARVEGGTLTIGAVHLAEDAVVDSYSVLEDDTSVGRRAHLRPLSSLSAGRRVPDGEVWDGAPARPSTERDEPMPPRPVVSRVRATVVAVADLASAIFVSVLFFAPAFPAFLLIDWIDVRTFNVFDADISLPAAFGAFSLMAVPASVVYLMLTMAATIVVRWLLPRQRAGTYAVSGLVAWRKRLMTAILGTSLETLHGLYASVFAPLWLRALGASVGARSEVSTAEGLLPDLLVIGDGAFVGDAAVLGDDEGRDGWLRFRPTRIGNRSFVGNGAYVPAGAVVPDNVLIGVQSRTPGNGQMAPGQVWLGSPPLLLPAREAAGAVPDSLTFHPSRLRMVARGLVEAVRMLAPLAVLIAAGYLMVLVAVPYAEDEAWTELAAVLALSGVVYGAASFGLVVAVKWLCVGRYRPRTAPMWTWFVWTSEAVTNIYESIAVPNFLDFLRGTPLLPAALRLLGARIGRGVYLDTTDMTEFDCVRIDDEAELNAWCGPQTHLFEDRVMKIGTVHIGRRATIGTRTTVLYDATVGDNVRLGPLSLVGKGEHLPPDTAWEGTPAQARDL